MATGQPSAASARAMAAPMPREPPVTRAQPSGVPLRVSSPGPPTRRRPAPHVKPAPKAARRTRSPRRDRCRVGRGAEGDGIDAAEVLPKRSMQSTTRSRVEPEALAERDEDARVRLVEDEEVDLVELEPAARGGFEGRLGHAVDGVAEGVVAVHVDNGLVARGA